VGWQFACFPVVAPVNYTQLRVYLADEKTANTAQFSNVFLYLISGTARGADIYSTIPRSKEIPGSLLTS